MTLASLPTLDAYVAFNPTNGATLTSANTMALPASGASNTYWTNVSALVRDFQTRSGRQHFLDRIEAGTLTMTVDNRTGYFLNGGSSGNNSGYVISPRMPIAVTATWSATTYPIYWGLTDSIQERVSDQVNSDLVIQASDLTKFLSLKYMTVPSFWATYATSASAVSWYRCDEQTSATVTYASGSGTTVTYTAVNTFQSGDVVTISGLGVATGASLNLDVVVVASATSTQFTVTNSTVGTSSGTGAAYNTLIPDKIGSYPGHYNGTVSFPTNGAIIYDVDACVDSCNGGTKVTGYMAMNQTSSTLGALDFWVLGAGIADTTLVKLNSGSYTVHIAVNATGYLEIVSDNGTNHYDDATSVKVDDGYWHHVGVVSNSLGYLVGYADGTFTALSTSLTGYTVLAGPILEIGLPPGDAFGPAPAYYDEVVVSSTAHLATLENEVSNRYIAGSLLQLPTNPANTAVKSGDRIAEILCLAGFGTISGGAVALNSNIYFINNGSAWVEGASGNSYCNVEPYFWQSPVTGSTALDLILQVCDTDIGIFFQKPDGTFAFYNQNFYGTWAWTTSTQTGTWTPNSYTPAADHTWVDDDSTAYAYYGPSLQILRDDADVWTTVKITPQSGVEQIYENTAAEARWGYSTLTKSGTVPTSLDSALSAAHFLGYLFASPLPRVQNVELRTETGNGANNVAVVGAAIGDPVTFKRTSPNASTSGTYPSVKGQIDALMVIESISIDFQADPGYWHASFTLSPYEIRS